MPTQLQVDLNFKWECKSINNDLYFKHLVLLYKGLYKLYGELHVFIEERENPEKTSGEGEENKDEDHQAVILLCADMLKNVF